MKMKTAPIKVNRAGAPDDVISVQGGCPPGNALMLKEHWCNHRVKFRNWA